MFRKKASRQQQDSRADGRQNVSSPLGRLGRYPIWLISLLGACGVFVLGGLLLWLIFGRGELNHTLLAEFSNPATVMIETTYKGTVTVPDFNLSSHGSLVTQQLNDAELPQDAMLDLLHAVAEHPLEMLTPVGGEPHPIAGGAQGSGFIVTPNGYLVTNAQVVTIEQSLKEQPAVQTAANTLNTLNENFRHNYHSAIPNDLQQALTRAFYNFYLRHITIHIDTQSYYAAMGAATPGTAVVQQGFHCTLVNVGAPLPGKDVAILKMEGANLPTLPCNDDALMKTGEQIVTIGYPAMTAFHTLTALQDNASVPTLEPGIIYAKPTMPEGWTVMQTDATITHGDSGGPALNSAGAVIGIATAGTLDPLTNQSVDGLNYIMPMSIVAEFLHKSHIRPTRGRFRPLYMQAVMEYNQQHYKTALYVFQQLNALSPGNPYVQDYLASAQNEITQGHDRSGESTLQYVQYGLVVVTLFVIGAGVYCRLRCRRPRRGSAKVS